MPRGRPKHPLSLARLKYFRHKAQAKFRSIPFLFDFDEWYAWWLNEGVDKNDPDTTKHSAWDRLCMCRYNDQGAYELNNVYCAPSAQNSHDQHRFHDYTPSKYLFRWGNWTSHYMRDLAQLSGLTHRKIQDYYKAHEYESRMLREETQLRNRYKIEYGPKKSAAWVYQGVEYPSKPSVIAVVGTEWQYEKARIKGLIQRIRTGPTWEEYYAQHRKYPPFSENSTKVAPHIRKEDLECQKP